MDSGIAGKIAIVTGGSRGIGRAIVERLAADGADVTFFYRGNRAAADEVCAALAAAGHKANAEQLDVRDSAACAAAVERVADRCGRIDILVNNAATNPQFGPIANLEERAWDAIMNTNVKSAWLLSKLVREAIKEHGEGGSIINVSSTGGLRASGGLGGYSVSKAAIIMLTQVCAKEWGVDGIRVNCIAPGLIKTEFSRALWDNEAILKNSLTQSPLRRIGDPDEMAGAVVYFASAASSFTTGQTLVLDGGGLA